MKKILVVLIASSSISFAFAATTASQVATTTAAAATTPAASVVATTATAPKFDTTQMKCGDKVLKNGDGSSNLPDICRGYKSGKNKATFLDDNSGKQVVCQAKNGKLILSSCQPRT